MSWNAKIVRVYKLPCLKSLSLQNYKELHQIYQNRQGIVSVNLNQDQSNSSKVSLPKLSKVCPTDLAKISLNWMHIGGLPSTTPFQKSNFDQNLYFSKIRFEYSKRTLNQIGFNAICEIDNTYELLMRDFEDFIIELENEKKKVYGMEVPIKVLI